VETTFNAKLPKVYVDGLIDGFIAGWAQSADSVNIYLSQTLITELPCDEFREDLSKVLDNPYASFAYKLATSDIKDEWKYLSSIPLKVEFVKNGHIEDIVDTLINMADLSSDLGFPLPESDISHNIEGLSDGYVKGWCSKAKTAEIYVDGEKLAAVACNVERNDLKDLVDDTICGFSYTLDACNYKPYWFKKAKLQLKVIFKSEDKKIIEQTSVSINSDELLNATNFFNGEDVTPIAQAIIDSCLWDEEYYFKQLEEDERTHKILVKDFIIKGSSTGKSPTPHFNTYYYLANNPDVAQHGINPFYHYILIGEKEGRRPVPYFNPALYLELNPDLQNWEAPLLFHLVQAGFEEGRVYNEYPQSTTNEPAANPYETWQLRNENYNFLETQSTLNGFKLKPLISMVVPVYNPDKALLEECINSVLRQSYTNWQLCLADDCSPEPHVREVLEHYQALDERIKVVFREQNGHISEASNSALEVAKGEWVALLDHDDELSQHALYEVVKVINEEPSTCLIYSDEDKISEKGERCDPHFKSDWNLDLLYSQNYVSHLGVYRTDIVKKIGGFRVGYEGSQDYDLLLRYSREIDHKDIVHIPKVLYHWRMVEGSTALGHGEKSYTTDAGIKALEDHFNCLGENVTVEQGMHQNIYKVNWPTTTNEGLTPLVSLVIPTYNGYEITKQAIDSILEKTSYPNYEILLVDNNSDDPLSLEYFEELESHEKVTVLRYPYPFNYSAINNFAASHANGEIIGLINNDVEVINSEWLSEMVSNALRPDIGCVGAMLYFHNDTIQHAGVIIGLGGVAGHSHKHFPKDHPGYMHRLKVVQNLSAVTAACLLVRKSVFDEVNGLNEKDLTVAFNDVDFCLKVQAAGYRNLWTPYAELYHYESISRGAEDNPEKVARFNKEMNYMKETWKTDVLPDVCYSRNLTRDREDFTINV
jgi:glycosyltransferase involved in cell wall biosynthesis